MGAWSVTCPECGFTGDDEDDFAVSLNDECTCPRCSESFEIDTSNSSDDDEHEEF